MRAPSVFRGVVAIFFVAWSAPGCKVSQPAASESSAPGGSLVQATAPALPADAGRRADPVANPAPAVADAGATPPSAVAGERGGVLWDGTPEDEQPPPAAQRPKGAPMVLVKGGAFTMGRAGSESEGPPHRVTLRDFVIDRNETTIAEYRACVAAGRCAVPRVGTGCLYDQPGNDRRPVTCVSFEQARAYCDWAGKRLPSEAEWELAARGTEGRTYPWGDQPPADQLCWDGGAVKRRSKRLGSCDVGQFPAGNTPAGISDLAGNVWEWTRSQFCVDYTRKHCTQARVVRGGSWWHNQPEQVTGTFRFLRPVEMRDDRTGFRCSRTAR